MNPEVRGAFAAYLEQRRRLGEPDLVLHGLDRRQALARLAQTPSSPWIISREHRERRSAGLARRDEGLVAALPARATQSEAVQRGCSAARMPWEVCPRAARRIASADSPAPAASPADLAQVVGDLDHDQLRDAALACTRCRLSEGRQHVVFADGNPEARVMVVGEAPGAREDATGVPFVGQAGRLLDLMLASVGLSRRESVYICNVLKCRPPGNRDPLPDEIESCAPLLKRQIEVVEPEVLVGVGSFAARWLVGRKGPLGKLRGEVHSYQGVPLVVTYHPAALLRNPSLSRLAWADLQLLCRVIDGADSAA